MPEPLVSVLIPVYNHARYVRQCLDSLLTEGWSNLEVLVTDDGSTDNSFEVIQEWRTEHPNAFVRFELTKQENQGLTKTLNRLVAKDTGEFVTLVASDDYLLPEGISSRVSYLQQNPHLLAVFGDCVVVNEGNHQILSSALTSIYKRSARPAALLCPDLISLELILRWSVSGPGLLLRKEAFERNAGVGPYDESLVVEDRDFYLRLLSRRSLGFINQIDAAYRWHQNNSVKAPVSRKSRQLSDLARSARKASSNFQGIERLALLVEAARQESATSRLSWLGLISRLSWFVLLRIQDARLYFHRNV